MHFNQNSKTSSIHRIPKHGGFDKFPHMLGPSHPNIWRVQQIPTNVEAISPHQSPNYGGSIKFPLMVNLAIINISDSIHFHQTCIVQQKTSQALSQLSHRILFIQLAQLFWLEPGHQQVKDHTNIQTV